jgi:hypothetical protein
LKSVIKLVFSKIEYLGMAAFVFVAMFMSISYLSEFVFFQPYFVFYVTEDRIISFAATLIVSLLSGVVIPMNIYRIRMLQNKARKMGGSFIGSMVGVTAGACSCGPIGFAIISTFGTVGGIATSFLSVYEIPLRLFSIGLLGLVYYTTIRSIKMECRI